MARVRKYKHRLSTVQIAELEKQNFSWKPLEEKWHQGFSELKQFIEKYGHLEVPITYKTKDGLNLGTWIRTQKANWNSLPKDRADLLEQLGFDPRTDKRWDIGFDHLSAYFEKETNCRVNQHYKTECGFGLGQWVSDQRKAKKKGKLEPKKIHLLNNIGFTWDAYEENWQQGYRYLKQFFEDNGHTDVPYGFKTKDGFALAEWVRTQRRYKTKILNERRILLQSVGFNFD